MICLSATAVLLGGGEEGTDHVAGGSGAAPAEADAGLPRPPTAREILLTAPIAAPRDSFFHAALEVPPLEHARNLPVGAAWLELETSHSRSIERGKEDGIENRFDGFLHEWIAVDTSAGVLPRLELGARAVLSGYDEQIDRFRLFDSQGNAIVREENVPGAGASKRHENVSDIVLRAKTPLLLREEAFFDLGFLSSIKIPIGRERDLTNAGTTDLNFVLLATVPVRPVDFHLNFGLGVPLGHQNLFTHEADVDLDPFFHGGAAAVWSVTDWFALDVQLEANSSAFGDVDFLDGPVFSFVPGLRFFFGPVRFDAAGGLPLSKQSCEFEVHFSLAYLFGAERSQAYGRWSAGGG